MYEDDQDEKMDWCLHYQNNGREELVATSVQDLYDINLTDENVLLFKDLSILFIKTEKKEELSKRKLERDEIDEQVDDYIKKFKRSICRNLILPEYVDWTLSQAKYKFVISQMTNYECQVIGFRFLKELKVPKHFYFKDFKIILSLLLCTHVQQFKKNEIIKNPSFGAYLTYLSCKFAKKEGFDYMFIRSADYGLMSLYQKWGFKFGLPFLDLSKFIPTFSHISDSYFQQISQDVSTLVKKDIYERLTSVKQNEYSAFRAFVNEEDPMEVANKLTQYMLSHDSYLMWIDLRFSDDVEKLREFSKNKLLDFFN